MSEATRRRALERRQQRERWMNPQLARQGMVRAAVHAAVSAALWPSETDYSEVAYGEPPADEEDQPVVIDLPGRSRTPPRRGGNEGRSRAEERARRRAISELEDRDRAADVPDPVRERDVPDPVREPETPPELAAPEPADPWQQAASERWGQKKQKQEHQPDRTWEERMSRKLVGIIRHDLKQAEAPCLVQMCRSAVTDVQF